MVWSSGIVDTSWSIVFVSCACSLLCSSSDVGGGTWDSDSGTNRVTRSRSRRSRAERSSFGNRTCRVNSTDRSAGDACLRGLLVDGVVAANGEEGFKDLIRDVMKARDCGSVIPLFVTVIRGLDDVLLTISSLLVLKL